MNRKRRIHPGQIAKPKQQKDDNSFMSIVFDYSALQEPDPESAAPDRLNLLLRRTGEKQQQHRPAFGKVKLHALRIVGFPRFEGFTHFKRPEIFLHFSLPPPFIVIYFFSPWVIIFLPEIVTTLLIK